MTKPLDDSALRRTVVKRASLAGVDFERRLSRARGCLLGGAIGDALGAPIEFLSRAEIIARFRPHGLTDFALAYGRLGAITDDTQMALLTAEGLLRAQVRMSTKGIGPIYGSIVDAAYKRWLVTQTEQPSKATIGIHGFDGWLITHSELQARRAPGTTCIQAIREKAVLGEPAINGSKGCGGVMRVAPVGVFCATLAAHDRPPIDRMTFDLGCELAGLTHGHATGQVTAGYFAVLVAALVAGASWEEGTHRAWEQLIDAKGHEETAAIVTRALEAADKEPWSWKQLAALGEGWTAEEALAISLYCAAGAEASGSSSEAVRDALLLAVNHDGDSDSTGAVTGNMLGALFGSEALPQTWCETVEFGNVVTELAEDLVTFPAWNVSEYSDSPEGDYWVTRYPPS